jgi:pimeloyl-ACP methyl ester carboxylesterase
MGNKAAKENNNHNVDPNNLPDDMDDDGEGEGNGPNGQKKLSYWQMMQQGYQELVNAIIRPPRCKYSPNHLGPAHFQFGGKTFQRTDFELRNLRGLKIVCSMWEPTQDCRQNPILPCVIYMHGNSSARLEAIPQLALVLSLGITMLSFDFCGSGLSEGDYVSLGAFEKDDLKVSAYFFFVTEPWLAMFTQQAVIEHLRSSGTTSTIALWGRSMGAATSLLHGERDPSLAGMVLDSSFADLQILAEEMVEKGRQHGLFAPSLIVKIAIRFIRSTVMKTAGFDIKTLSPIEHADKCFIPALFIAAEGDMFVPPHHRYCTSYLNP